MGNRFGVSLDAHLPRLPDLAASKLADLKGLAPQSGYVSNFGVLPTASDKCGFSTDSSTCGCLSTRLGPKRSTRLHSSSFSDQTPGLIFAKLEPKHDQSQHSGGQDPPLALSRSSRKW